MCIYRGMTRQRSPYEQEHCTRANFTLPVEMLEEFRRLCERRGVFMSTEVRRLIARELERAPGVLSD